MMSIENIEVQIERELPGWSKIRCTECDSVLAYFSPEKHVHSDNLTVYCFPCASNLAVKDN